MNVVISSDNRTSFLHSSLLTGAIALFAFLLALLLGIKLWIAAVGAVLLLLVTVGLHRISAKTSSENHARAATNVGLVLTTIALITEAPDSLKQHSAPESKGAVSPVDNTPPAQLETLAPNDLLVDNKESAQLTVCKIESPGVNDTENVSYRARVHWRRSPTSGIATFHIGAINPNGEFWPQMTSARIAQGQDVQVDFVVSRQSMFPTRFVVVGLDRFAEEARANTCRPGSSCYLQLPRAGVFQVSDEFSLNSFDESVPGC